eukprot:XP_002261688.1 hypothetical protein, conserved in Plasmodium species [Plasmodium knowlesi strain H]
MSECDVEIFFDYIVQIEDVKLQDASRRTYESFMQKVREGENKEVCLLVYSCRHDKLKEVHVRPRKWRGKGLLGMNISYEKANTMKEGIQIVRIEDGYLDVKNKVTEKEDIIIGHEENILRNCNELCNFVETNISGYNRERKKAPLELSFYVYNKKKENVRMVKMQVDPTWARHGLLGCHVGEMNTSVEEEGGKKGDVMKGDNDKMKHEVMQEATPYGRCTPPERTKHLADEQIEWNAELAMGSNNIELGRNQMNGEELEGEDRESTIYDRFNTHYFRGGSGAGAFRSSLGRSLGNCPGGAEEQKADGAKSYYTLSSTIEVEGCAEVNQDMHTEDIHSDASSGREKRNGNEVKEVMHHAQMKNILHTSSISQEWNPPQEKEQLPPDEGDTPASRYEKYVQNIKTYSKEMIEVYKDMDENSKLLEELKLRTMKNFAMGEKLVGEEIDYLDEEVSVAVEGFSGWAHEEGDINEITETCEVEMDGNFKGERDGILM